MAKAAPKFKVGDVLRYSAGTTAFMLVSHVSQDHGPAHRYYGDSFFGSPMGAYEHDCHLASEHEQKKWRQAHPGEGDARG